MAACQRTTAGTNAGKSSLHTANTAKYVARMDLVARPENAARHTKRRNTDSVQRKQPAPAGCRHRPLAAMALAAGRATLIAQTRRPCRNMAKAACTHCPHTRQNLLGRMPPAHRHQAELAAYRRARSRAGLCLLTRNRPPDPRRPRPAILATRTTLLPHLPNRPTLAQTARQGTFHTRITMQHAQVYLEDQEYIALCDLLKLAGLADTGGQAKAIIAAGEVLRNGTVETRKTAKIRAGEWIEYVGCKLEIYDGYDPEA